MVRNNSTEMIYLLINKYICVCVGGGGFGDAKLPNNMITKSGFFFHTSVVGAYSEDYSDPPSTKKKKEKIRLLSLKPYANFLNN